MRITNLEGLTNLSNFSFSSFPFSKAYAEFIGKPYIIPPAYEISKYSQSEKSKKNTTKKANIKRGGKTIKNHY